MISVTTTNRFPERRREFEARFRASGPEIAEQVGEVVEEEAQLIAVTRIESPSVSGGYLDDFKSTGSVQETKVEVLTTNTSDHAYFVELGRKPQEPVMAAYKDNAQNRRRGRVGGSYVHHYKGMPPSGIFKDGLPDWARRLTIARDGFPGRHVFRELKSRGRSVAVIAVLRSFGRRLLGGF